MITARELRIALTQVEDQGLTVQELRSILYYVLDQDAELTDTMIARLTMPEKKEETA